MHMILILPALLTVSLRLQGRQHLPRHIVPRLYHLLIPLVPPLLQLVLNFPDIGLYQPSSHSTLRHWRLRTLDKRLYPLRRLTFCLPIRLDINRALQAVQEGGRRMPT